MEDIVRSTSTPELSIILVSYNTRELTLHAIRSLIAETDPDIYELIVLDNASADGSAEAISQEFPDVDLRALEENLGFAGANNLGAHSAKGQYLLLLNPDTIVLDDAVGRLHRFAKQHPESRLWGGRTLFADRSLNPASCWNRMTPWSVFFQMTGLKSIFPRSELINSEALGGWKRDTVREVDIVSGCFLLIETRLWTELGGFNLRYFMYGEDADLCLRAKKAGAQPIICPEAQIVHYAGASEPVRADKMKRLLRAKITLMRDHWTKRSQPVGYFLLWTFPLPRILGYRLAAWLRDRPGDDENATTWREIWQARREWLSGYAQRDGIETHQLQIVVVDNSADGSAESLCTSLNKDNLHYVHEPRPGLAFARNCGIENATGDYLAFLDDDEQADATWILELNRAFENSDADVVFGKVVPKLEEADIGHSEYVTSFYTRDLGRLPLADIADRLNFVGTGNSAYRRAICFDYGVRADERFNLSGGEDIDLFRKLKEQGRRFAWAPGAVVFEWVSSERAGLDYLKERRRSQGQQRVDSSRRDWQGLLARRSPTVTIRDERQRMIARWISNLRSAGLVQLLFVGTVVFLAWVPLPFGSNRLWSESLLNVWAATLLVGYFALSLQDKKYRIDMRQLALPGALFSAVILWAFVQWSSWTPSEMHHPVWALAGDALGKELPGRLTVNPHATLTSIAGLLGYACTFLVGFQIASSPRRGMGIVKAVALTGGLYGWYGLLVYLSGNETILLYEKWEYLDDLSATFVNRNSFATFAGIGLLCALAILLRGISPVLQSHAAPNVKTSQTVEILFRQYGPYLFAAVGLFIALMLSGSRAGIGSTALAVTLLIFLMLRSRRMKTVRLLGTIALMLSILSVAAIPFSEPVLSRLEREDTILAQNSRIEVYRLTLSAISDAPIAGTGLGTFGDVFPYYRDGDVFTSSAWVKAHNTYLETLLELGIPAGLALFAAIGSVAWKCARSVRQFRRRRAMPAVATAATLLVAIHSVLDFSMQIPAVAAIYSALLGVGAGTVTRASEAEARGSASSVPAA
eukprot:s1_g1517.t1